MIFLHFSSAAILFPLQHNMAGPHFSVKALCLPFCKIANGLCTCTFFAYVSVDRETSFYHLLGARGVYIRRRLVKGTVGVHDSFLWGCSAFVGS